MQSENHQQNNLNFTAIQYKSGAHFIPFKKYWKQYIGFIILTILFAAYAGDLFVIIIIVATVYFGNIISKGKNKTFAKFASDNNWVISGKNFTAPIGIRWVGHSHKSHDVIKGAYQGAQFQLAEHEYTTGGGKSSRTHRLTIMQLEIGARFPYILLDSKNNSGGAAQIPKVAEKLSLEGDFDKYFQMYSQPKHRVDALSLISPDVMQTVMTASKQYDIEVYENKVYLYVEGDKRSKQYIQDLFSGADRVLYEISHKSKSFKALYPESIGITKSDMKKINNLFGLREDISSVRWVMVLIVISIFIAVFITLIYVLMSFNV